MKTRTLLGTLLWSGALLTTLTAAPSIAAAEIKVEAGRSLVIARDGAQEVWRHTLGREVATPEQVAEAAKKKDENGKPALPKGEHFPIVGPARVGQVVYYSHRGNLYETDARSGVVQRRFWMYGEVAALTAEGEGVTVTLKGDSSRRYAWTETLKLAPGKGDVPFMLADQLTGLFQPERVACNAAPDFEAAVFAARDRNATRRPDYARRVEVFDKNAHAQELSEAIPKLEAMWRQDPTTPASLLRMAEYQWLLDQPERATMTIQRLIDRTPQANAPELLRGLLMVDSHDPALGQALFKRALTSWLAQGFDPRLQHTLIAYMILVGVPDRFNLEDRADAERFERFTSYIYALSPNMEASAHLYHTLSTSYASAGNGAGAELWASRAKTAQQYSLLGSNSRDTYWLIVGLNLMFACVAAFWLSLFIKLGRTIPAGFRGEVPTSVWSNPFSRMTRGEVGGLVAVVALFIWIGGRVATGVKIIGVAASAPIAMLSGSFGHPSVQQLIEKAPPAFEGEAIVRFVQALSHDQRGRAEEAFKGYESLTKANTPFKARALNNLGVLKARAGDEAGASALYRQALKADPQLAEAHHNLGKTPEGSYLSALAAVAPGQPMRAVLPDAAWTDFWRMGLDEGRPTGLFGGVREIMRKTTEPLRVVSLVQSVSADDDASIGAPLGLGGGFMLVLGFLLFVALFAPGTDVRLATNRLTWPAWLGGWLTPGAARQYGVLGPLFMTFALYALINMAIYTRTGGMGTNILSSIAMPAFNRYFGLSDMKMMMPPGEALCVQIAQLFWLFPLLNIMFAPLAEWIAPDPGGPLYAKLHGEDD